MPGVKNIVGQRGLKASSQITSDERGLLQTVLMSTNAAGDYIPLMIIYKGKRMLPELATAVPKSLCLTLVM